MKTSHIITSYFLRFLKKCFSNLSPRKRFYISSRLGSIFYNYLSIRKKQARKNILKAFPQLDSNQIEKILTPVGDDGRTVSPVGVDIDWTSVFGPGAPGSLGNSESDATPI